MNASCQYPMVAPSRENPAGDCRAPRGRYAVPLGTSGRHLVVCDPHAARYSPSRLVLVDSIEEDP